MCHASALILKVQKDPGLDVSLLTSRTLVSSYFRQLILGHLRLKTDQMNMTYGVAYEQ